MPQEKRKLKPGEGSRSPNAKLEEDDSDSEVPLKKQRDSNSKSRADRSEGDVIPQSEWPSYFRELYKIFKALNTVLAFCSSRKHLAITFPVVRSSVEKLLKRPLELEKVAELKALLPDLIRFAYVPRDQLQINSDGTPGTSSSKERRERGRERSPDYSAFSFSDSTPGFSLPTKHEDEHVLVLDFAAAKGSGKGKKPAEHAGFQLPPSMTPAAVKKLIEKRNQRFECSVAELLLACAGDDPENLLRAAARDHIPVNPDEDKQGNEPHAGPSKPEAVPNSAERESINSILEEIQSSESYKEQIVYRRIFDAQEGRIGTLAVSISDSIREALLSARKISSFYIHQAAAIDAIREGRHVIVSTSTASGKSVIYQVPMLRFLEEDPSATAIYIYPTKALAQDQRIALEQLLWLCDGLKGIQVANYDGDTAKDKRKSIRETASVIFTNFDMLHASILPREEEWRRFFQNLKVVAVDELHYYTGAFGTHVSYIIRRLRRICVAVGNRRVRFVSCSATISNPYEHMSTLVGVDNIEVITDDGAPSGRKDFIMWHPPPNDPMDPSLGRHSSLLEATALMRELMRRGVRTIMFTKFRKMCELAMKNLRSELSAEGRADILKRVMAYRGGYSQNDRRKIEAEAFSGNLLGIVATNALELGVDIGVLDAVIMLGFPFGVASLRQQMGRAGRRSRDALAVLVADSLPLDQHFVQFPNDIFDKRTNELLIEHDNKLILEAHVQCAAHEIPLTEEDTAYFGPRMLEICDSRLEKDKEGWYFPSAKFLPYPSRHISIRGIQEETYTVIDVTNREPKLLEEIEMSRAMFETFEGAVFMHQGLTFIVQEISHESKIAKLIRADINWTTKPRDFTDIDARQTSRIREIKGSSTRAFYGRVDLKTIVFGYFKVRHNVILDAVDLEMPPFERSTSGFWIDISKSTLGILRSKNVAAAEAIHSAAHAFLNRFSMQTDLNTECKVPVKEYLAKHSKRKRPARLIFYDNAGTQGNVSAKAFDHVSDLMHDAFETVESCKCEEGCEKCIQSPYCREHNIVASKIGAQIVIRSILGLPIGIDAIPEGDVEVLDTIVEAEPVRAAAGVEVELYVDGPYT